MRFTHPQTVEQVDLQARHRIRDQLVAGRTGLINQMRAFCPEDGVAIRQGAGIFRRDLPGVLADEDNDLTPAMRRMLGELFEEVTRLDQRIAVLTREIDQLAIRHDHARQLMTIPGFGPLVATALLAAIGDGCQFRHARDLAAWLGLAWYPSSTRPVARRRCSASTSAGTDTCDGFSSMAPGHA
jgi:transposase